MQKHGIVAGCVVLVGVNLFTTLLVCGVLNSASYVVLLGLVTFAGIAISAMPRLREFDIKNLKATLEEARTVRAEVEAKTAELTTLYSKLEHLKARPFSLDPGKMQALGLGSMMSSGVMRYPAGCIKRERERLARIFAEARSPEVIARAILDDSLDELVFKWNGPETSLDSPPKSVEERQTGEAKARA